MPERSMEDVEYRMREIRLQSRNFSPWSDWRKAELTDGSSPISKFFEGVDSFAMTCTVGPREYEYRRKPKYAVVFTDISGMQAEPEAAYVVAPEIEALLGQEDIKSVEICNSNGWYEYCPYNDSMEL